MQAAEQPAQYREGGFAAHPARVVPDGGQQPPDDLDLNLDSDAKPCHDTYGRPKGTLVKEILRHCIFFEPGGTL
jgi:hypothetical protein